MSTPHLTQEMIQVIEETASRFEVDPQIVLRRMVFSYAHKHSGKREEPDMSNVVRMRETP